MSEENTMRCEQPEMIIMIGITASGKSYYVDQYYSKSHQIISENHIVEAMKLEGIAIQHDFKHAVMAVMTRALMLRKLPIVIDEPNLLAESLFMWNSIAYKHKYKTKAIVIDTPLDICINRLEDLVKNIDKNILKAVEKQHEQLKELQLLLNSKYQKIVDEIVFVDYNTEGIK